MKSGAVSAVGLLRTILRWLICAISYFSGLVVTGLGLAGMGPSCFAQSVILITVDTLRADHVHSFGYSVNTSPSLDMLGSDGYRFTSAYTPVPLTLPSHTAMMTGTYPFRNKVHENGDIVGTEWPTLADLFQRRGFRTGAIVSTPILDHRFGLNRGFEYYEDKLIRDVPGRVKRPASRVVDIAIDWVGEHRGAPFFLWIHLYDVHRPYRVPQELISRFSSPYDASIAFADQELGRFFSRLKSWQLYNATTIAVIGDHGEGLGDHGEETHGFFLYDSTLHVPFILKPAELLKGCAAPGTAISEPIQTLDIYSTLLQLGLHTGLRQQRDSRSLVPLLCGVEDATPRPLFAENQSTLHFGWSALYSIRVGRYKFVEAPHEELYDTADDPTENVNLIDREEHISSALASTLFNSYEHYMEGRSRGARLADPKLASLLESLGYMPGRLDIHGRSRNGAIDPKDRVGVIRLYMAATESEARGEVRQASALVQKALKLGPESPPLHRLKGALLLKENTGKSDIETAAAEFAQVLSTTPDDLASLQGLISAKIALGDFESAVNILRQYLHVYPSDSSAFVRLGDCLTRLHGYRAATRAYRKAISLNDQNMLAWRSYGALLLTRNELARSEEVTKKAIQIDPYDSSLHELLSNIYLRQGNIRRGRQEEAVVAGLLNGVSVD